MAAPKKGKCWDPYSYIVFSIFAILFIGGIGVASAMAAEDIKNIGGNDAAQARLILIITSALSLLVAIFFFLFLLDELQNESLGEKCIKKGLYRLFMFVSMAGSVLLGLASMNYYKLVNKLINEGKLKKNIEIHKDASIVISVVSFVLFVTVLVRFISELPAKKIEKEKKRSYILDNF